MNIKKIFKLFFIILVLISVSFVVIHAYNKNKKTIINTKFVNSINSELYQEIKLYELNENNAQYEIKKLIFTKENIELEIFYYYNDKYDYLINSISYDKEANTININIDKESKEIKLVDFKLIKLSYDEIGVEHIRIIKDDNIIII